MWRGPRLIDHTVNQRLTGLYLLYVALAVVILTLELPIASTSATSTTPKGSTLSRSPSPTALGLWAQTASQ